ncbi:MAG: SET domain-containing protein [Chitinophagales bacterium]
MMLASLYIEQTDGMGKGVFTRQAIDKGSIIEIAPVLVMEKEDRRLLDQTLLHDYIFEWGQDKHQCCIALGYVSIYNHSYHANCEYEMDYEKEIMTIKSVRYILPGQELFINYNGDWDNKKPVWFKTS